MVIDNASNRDLQSRTVRVRTRFARDGPALAMKKRAGSNG